MTSTSTDLKNLETISLFISMDVQHAMWAAIVKVAASSMFYDHQDWFSTNPANTLPYSALRSLEDRAVVHIAEVLKD